MVLFLFIFSSLWLSATAAVVDINKLNGKEAYDSGVTLSQLGRDAEAAGLRSFGAAIIQPHHLWHRHPPFPFPLPLLHLCHRHQRLDSQLPLLPHSLLLVVVVVVVLQAQEHSLNPNPGLNNSNNHFLSMISVTLWNNLWQHITEGRFLSMV
jgi:hypothetical protein